MQEIVNYQINTVVLCDNASTHTAEAAITKIEEFKIYTIFISRILLLLFLLNLYLIWSNLRLKQPLLKTEFILGENLEKNEFTMYYEPYHLKWLEDAVNN